ncbi:TonB-dependent siderophore receptor [Aureimonas flava]|uniref:TonB-dependent siderophore receptor n=1 Tax=Aureimonas flava TaxID=2320271 RepID=A0A3A1WL67_9HYPH|nr:TonB-dependent siderophore receptor [Aureimonas flava]RIY01062.1 TonB-dependent siderophore receptor [Aureimonas flava]
MVKTTVWGCLRGGVSATAVALGLCGGLVGGTGPVPVFAQGSQTYAFRIPPKPLLSALADFTAVTGVQIVRGGSRPIAGTSGAVSGRLSADEAAARLLSGSGLTYRFTSPRTLLVEAPGEAAGGVAADGTVVLDMVVVDGGGESAFGPVDGIVATRSATGTKTETPLKETPQAINVVTADQMARQGSQTVTEALRYTPGVIAQYGNSDLRHDWLTVRGFTPGRYLDGLRLPFGARGYSQPRIEPFGLERVEVLKGPASLLYGQGNPGGTLNMVSKRPTEERVREIQVQGGRYSRAELAGDFGGRLDEEGRWLGRIAALGRMTDTETDFVEENKLFVAPSLTWRPSDATSLTLLGQYQRIDAPGGGQAPGLPADGTLYPDPVTGRFIERGTFIGQPGYDHFENEQWFAGYEFAHELSDQVEIRQNLRYGEVDTHSQRVQGFCFPTTSLCSATNLGRYAWAFPESAKLFTVDNQAEVHFDTGPLEHTALIGLDYLDERSDFSESNLQYVNFPRGVPGYLAFPYNVFSPGYSLTAQVPKPATVIDQTRSQLGLYAQDQVKFGGWSLVGGLRQDWADTTTDTTTVSTSTTRTTDQSDSALTGRAGLLYSFDNGITPYVSYATSFQPAAGTDRLGSAFDPTEGEQIEVGLKYEPTGINALFTLSAFQLTQTNVLTPDPLNYSFSVQTGEVEIRGLELEGKAELADGLELIASYAYQDSEITKANPSSAAAASTLGNRLAFVPEHQASAWLDYTFGEGPLHGFGLGGGLRYTGQTFGDNANRFDIPSFTLFDASVRYDFGALSPKYEGVTLKVDATNLLDKTYVSTCIAPVGCYYGEGRMVYATMNVKF